MKSFKTRYLSSAVAAAVASTLPTLVSAQDESADLEEVVVTGTRLTKSTLHLYHSYRSVKKLTAVVLLVSKTWSTFCQTYSLHTAVVANGASGTSTLTVVSHAYAGTDR